MRRRRRNGTARIASAVVVVAVAAAAAAAAAAAVSVGRGGGGASTPSCHSSSSPLASALPLVVTTTRTNTMRKTTKTLSKTPTMRIPLRLSAFAPSLSSCASSSSTLPPSLHCRLRSLPEARTIPLSSSSSSSSSSSLSSLSSWSSWPSSSPSSSSSSSRCARSYGTSLRDINGWRDVPYDHVASEITPETLTSSSSFTSCTSISLPPPREICVLPFPYTDVLLQGETKELRLYEDRFLSLFDDAMTNHCQTVAMGLLADSGIVQTVPLCDIEAYQRLDGFGIFVTIRAVGRATLVRLLDTEPYIRAVCVELVDALPPNLELPSLVAGNIEDAMMDITALEHRLEAAAATAAATATAATTTTTTEKETEAETDIDEGVIDEEAGKDGDDKHGDGDDEINNDNGEMQDRIMKARLDDVFYSDAFDVDDVDNVGSDETMLGSIENDQDEEDQDEDDSPLPDRAARFRLAYEAAKAADSQGYTISSSSSSSSTKSAQPSLDRSAQDLTALSWAAFCTDPPMDMHGESTARYVVMDEDGNVSAIKKAQLSIKDVTYKIQAMDCTNLMERLKLASFMLKEKRSFLKERMDRLKKGR